MALSLKMYGPSILALSCSLAGCAETSNEAADIPPAPATSVVFNPAGAPTVEFTLPDMMCEDGCAMTVKDILVRQSGVTEVAVDFEGKTATVAIDESTFDSDQALAELVDKGFLNSALAGDGPHSQAQAAHATTPPQPAPVSSPSD